MARDDLGDGLLGGSLATRDAKFQLAGVIRRLMASECECDVSYRYRLVVPGRGATNRRWSSVTALIICRQVAQRSAVEWTPATAIGVAWTAAPMGCR
jgi:hypothetical protein